MVGDPYLSDRDFTLYNGEAWSVLRDLIDESVDCIVTSPPYWSLRDYGHADQLGRETTVQQYVTRLGGICDELRRVLRDDGTFWLVIDDKYVDKELVGVPWMVAFELKARGWKLRLDGIWSKPNGMTESVTDRPTRTHEYGFMFSKSARYFYNQDAVREPNHPDGRRKTVHDTRTDKSHENYRGRTGGGKERWPNELGRNRRSVWEIPTEPYPDAHFAVFPQELVEGCVKAGCPEGGIVLDPFMGAGTTALVARRLGRRSIGDRALDRILRADRAPARPAITTFGGPMSSHESTDASGTLGGNN